LDHISFLQKVDRRNDIARVLTLCYFREHKPAISLSTSFSLQVTRAGLGVLFSSSVWSSLWRFCWKRRLFHIRMLRD